MHQYSINLAWSDEDDGYIATVPEFQNLSAFGSTPEEALHEANIVLNDYIEVCKQENESLPEPMKLTQFSGQTRLRLPTQLHMRLALQSAREKVSLNTYMVSLLSMNFAIDAFLAKQSETIREVISSLAIVRPAGDIGWAAREIDDVARNRLDDTTVKYTEV